jgi:Bacterial Ig domain
MDRTVRALLALAIAGVVASSATFVTAAGVVKVWIDEPLPGDVRALAPAPVTVHAASDVGINKVRFLVDGSPAAEVPAQTGDLATITWTWQPPGLGTHVLTAFAISMDGMASAPTSVAVTFVERGFLPPTPAPSGSTPPRETAASSLPPGVTPPPVVTPPPGPTLPPGATPAPTPHVTLPPGATPTPTPAPTKSPKPSPTPTKTPTPTPTPTRPPAATPTPTPAPCIPGSATLLSPEYGAAIGESQPDLEWTYNGRCLVFEWQVEVSTSSSFNDLVALGVVPGNQDYWPVDVTLQACVDYWWRVVGFGGSGQIGAYSANGLFHVIGRSCP